MLILIGPLTNYNSHETCFYTPTRTVKQSKQHCFMDLMSPSTANLPFVWASLGVRNPTIFSLLASNTISDPKSITLFHFTYFFNASTLIQGTGLFSAPKYWLRGENFAALIQHLRVHSLVKYIPRRNTSGTRAITSTCFIHIYTWMQLTSQDLRWPFTFFSKSNHYCHHT